MTQQEWENATEEERTAEYERCKDPVYMYNTYWILPNGDKPKPITHEQWEQIELIAKSHRERIYARRYPKPLTYDEVYLPEYFKPSPPAQD